MAKFVQNLCKKFSYATWWWAQSLERDQSTIAPILKRRLALTTRLLPHWRLVTGSCLIEALALAQLGPSQEPQVSRVSHTQRVTRANNNPVGSKFVCPERQPGELPLALDV